MKTRTRLNAKALTAYLEHQAMSKNELCRRAGLGRTAITRLCNGTRSPRADTVARIAAVLGCSSDDLLLVEEVTKAEQIDPHRNRAALRMSAFLHYGTECACCGEDEYHFLSVDHVTPGKPDTGNPRFLYVWLAARGFPPGFQTLCHNCNFAKADKPRCPHNSPLRFPSDAARKRWGVKLDTLKAYGGRCACCRESNPRFLTLDHVNKDGEKHRDAVSNGSSGYVFYRKLRAAGYPNDPPLRVLCQSCNMASFSGRCPHEFGA